ncbi:hypothetical protein TNCT_549021 [Trichonephila clavata]|uniref:Uncharacterized protein n=1 Tax=Trichonephila clavata TaxID=2740835 RepID=A0A8X6IXJ9_TRICU|nr:hypothetical protein TNCT_549021 [Trichonephila clavata]
MLEFQLPAYLMAISMLNVLFALLSKRVAAIPEDAIASAILFCDLIVARIIEIRKVLPVPPGASKKYKPQLLLDIAFIIVPYAVRCSNTNFGR